LSLLLSSKIFWILFLFVSKELLFLILCLFVISFNGFKLDFELLSDITSKILFDEFVFEYKLLNWAELIKLFDSPFIFIALLVLFFEFCDYLVCNLDCNVDIWYFL